MLRLQKYLIIVPSNLFEPLCIRFKNAVYLLYYNAEIEDDSGRKQHCHPLNVDARAIWVVSFAKQIKGKKQQYKFN